MKFFKKLGIWFWTKNKTIDEIVKINKILDFNLIAAVSALEELDQEKIYVCYLKDATAKDIENAIKLFNLASKRMRWTLPKILFTNTKIEESDKK